MHNESTAMLLKVCCDVFEQLAFMFGEIIEKDDVSCDSNSFLRAHMSFKGDRTGTVEIVLPAELAETLAINILGIDDSDNIEPGTSEDAVKELLNTVCGRLLTVLYGEEAVFDLSVPSTSVLDNQQWKSALDSKSYSAIDIEDNPVLALVSE
jgi:CheY-specific phosphatase CheX